MSPQAQRRAIFEACGYFVDVNEALRWFYGGPPPFADGQDPLNDLNSMRKVEETLDPTLPENSDIPSDTWEHFEIQLLAITERDDPKVSPIHASAAQRAEAFLRAKGLWE